jgi:hypothetical protein
MLNFSWFWSAFAYVVLGSIANDMAPLLVGGVNICDNQHQNLAKSLGLDVLIQCYVKRPKLTL